MFPACCFCQRTFSRLLDFLLKNGTRPYKWSSVGGPARVYLHQLCVDFGYSFEDLPEAMDERDRWEEREGGREGGEGNWCCQHDLIMIMIYIYIYIYMIGYKKCKQRLLLLLLKIKYLKIPLANVVRLVAEFSET